MQQNQKIKTLLMFALPLLSIFLATCANFYFAFDIGINALCTGLILLLSAGGIVSFVIGIVSRKIGFCLWAICIGTGLYLHIFSLGKFLPRVYESQYSETIKSGGVVISAIERYHQDNQAFPTSLEELKPKYLQQLPHTQYKIFFKEGLFRLIPDASSRQNSPRLLFTKDIYLLCEYSFAKKSWYCN
jgi:hypothetical protein